MAYMGNNQSSIIVVRSIMLLFEGCFKSDYIILKLTHTLFKKPGHKIIFLVSDLLNRNRLWVIFYRYLFIIYNIITFYIDILSLTAKSIIYSNLFLVMLYGDIFIHVYPRELFHPLQQSLCAIITKHRPFEIKKMEM